jgi:HPt (histidine-containing phosphotransfer) domain-containing protein
MTESTHLTDLSYLRSLTGNQTDKIAKYIRMFLTGAPISVSQLELYTLSKDWNGVKETAHSLKPQLGYFGAKNVEQMLKDIEHIAGEQSGLETLPGRITALRSQFDQISVELESALKELGV